MSILLTIHHEGKNYPFYRYIHLYICIYIYIYIYMLYLEFRYLDQLIVPFCIHRKCSHTTTLLSNIIRAIDSKYCSPLPQLHHIVITHDLVLIFNGYLFNIILFFPQHHRTATFYTLATTYQPFIATITILILFGDIIAI